MKLHSPEDTDLYVKGRGWQSLGTGLRFVRTPCLKPGDQEFNAYSGKVWRKTLVLSTLEQYIKREPIPYSRFKQKRPTELQIPEKV